MAVGAAGGMTFMAILSLRRAMRRDRPSNEPESVPWLWMSGSKDGKKYAAFCCPKCREWSKKDYQPPFCECHEFPRGHFHFGCVGCKFTCIMRTADDDK
jgi:hypothetical protein